MLIQSRITSLGGMGIFAEWKRNAFLKSSLNGVRKANVGGADQGDLEKFYSRDNETI